MPARTVGRIQSRAAFGELQRSRARASSGPVRATFVPVGTAEQGIFPQVGYAIGRSCGNAVVRNSLRRRMRQSAREVAVQLPRGRYLLRVAPGAAAIGASEFRDHVTGALLRSGHTGKASA